MGTERVYVPLIPTGCKQCRWVDRVEVPIGTDAYTVYKLLRTAHFENSPICHHHYGAQYVVTLDAAEPLACLLQLAS